MRKGDITILLIVIMAGGLYWFFSHISLNTQAQVNRSDIVVLIDGQEIYRAPLSLGMEDYISISLAAVQPRHPGAKAILEVFDGYVRVMPMPLELCPNQICCHRTRPINRPGQMIVCMPNLMVIRVESSGDPGYDLLAG